MSDSTIDYVTIQVEAPPEVGTFIIGVNHVGDRLTQAGVEVEWTDLTGPVTGMRIVRGGELSGVTVALDGGILTVTFANLETAAAIAPNRPVRVITTDDASPLFTGRILDLASTDDKDGNTITTLIGVDSVRNTGNVKVTQVISPDGWESWAARIARLCEYSDVPTNPPGA